MIRTTGLLAAGSGLALAVTGAAEAAEVIATGASATGPELTNGDGMSLYVFDKDHPAVSNRCHDCAAIWPPHAAGAAARPQGAFGIVLRADGSRQWTYRGKPLYTRVNDAKPGTITGEGVKDLWHIAKPRAKRRHMRLLDEIEAAIPGLRRAARAMTRDRDAAEGLVQDSLGRALARRRLRRGEGPVAAWIWKIMLNLHRDGLGRQSAHLVVVADLPGPPAYAAGAEERAAPGAVKAAMERLPADQKQALVLVVLERMSPRAAARLLGIPEATLVSRLGSARAGLRAMTGRAPQPARKGDAS